MDENSSDPGTVGGQAQEPGSDNHVVPGMNDNHAEVKMDKT